MVRLANHLFLKIFLKSFNSYVNQEENYTSYGNFVVSNISSCTGLTIPDRQMRKIKKKDSAENAGSV